MDITEAASDLPDYDPVVVTNKHVQVITPRMHAYRSAQNSGGFEGVYVSALAFT